MKSLLRRAVAALSLPLLAAAPLHAQALPPPAHPALWAVSDADTTVYLFGTIHLLPDNYQWRTPAFDQAVENSQQLVVETIIDLQHPQSFLNDRMKLGFAPGLPPILDRVPPKRRPLLQAAIAKSGIPEKVFDQMKTWNAAIQLLGLKFLELGLKGQEGPEEVLKTTFTAEHKPIGELESNSEQLEFFDKLPEQAQRQLLEGAIDPVQNAHADFDPLFNAWSRGDVPAIGVSFNKDLSDSPEIRDALVKVRNATWSHWIEQRMGAPGTILVAVGAGHLAGKDSVINLLEKDGYQVRRVQ